MAAGFMPAHNDAPDLEGRPCAICTKGIAEGQRFYQRDRWSILGHGACVEDHLDQWDALPDESLGGRPS